MTNELADMTIQRDHWLEIAREKDAEIERLQKDRNECLEAFHILFRIFPEPK